MSSKIKITFHHELAFCIQIGDQLKISMAILETRRRERLLLVSLSLSLSSHFQSNLFVDFHTFVPLRLVFFCLLCAQVYIEKDKIKTLYLIKYSIKKSRIWEREGKEEREN